LSVRLLYTPTHRRCERSFESVQTELKFARHVGETMLFLLIEHNLSDADSWSHARSLGSIDSANVIHLTSALKREWIRQIVNRLRVGPEASGLLMALLVPQCTSYGQGPNLAYLAARSFGAQVVHRRDSDVTLPHADRTAVEMEVRGGSLAATDIYVVGTGTFGDPTFDRRDLLAAGLEFLLDYQCLGNPNISRTQVRAEALDYLVDEPRRYYDDDFIVQDMDWQVEMEVCAIGRMFELVPEMPTCDMLGSDYMVKDVAYRTGCPILFHSRKWEHRYEGSRRFRARDSDLVSYYLRDLRYLQFGRIWHEHWERRPIGYWTTTTFSPEEFGRVFVEAALDIAPEVADVRLGAARVYQDAAESAGGLAGQRRSTVAQILRREGNRFDKVVLDAARNYALLIEYWPSLMDAAESVGPPPRG
jgi:Family of unknown function (DUF6271)